MKLLQVLLIAAVSLFAPTVAVNAAAVDTIANDISDSNASITLRNDKSSSKCSSDNLELVCDELTASIKSHWNEYLLKHNKLNGKITDLDMKCSMGWDSNGGLTGIPVEEVTNHALRKAGGAILQKGLQLFDSILARYHPFGDGAPTMARDNAFPRRQLRGTVGGEEDALLVVDLREDMESAISEEVTKDFQELIRTKTVTPCKETFSGWQVDFEWM